LLFNSYHFLLFFPLVTIGYFVLPVRLRWAWLLAASCCFYMVFKPIYILILAFTIVIDYFAGIYIHQTQAPDRKKKYLIASLIANIGVLAIFKYYNFFNENVSVFLGSFNVKNNIPYLDILLPIGLSFHTFQAMSYTIEIYKGNQRPERHFGIYALYVMFYPQLVAGPIERPQNVLHQFRATHVYDYQRTVQGLQRMAWGMFKKVVVADNLALYVNKIFEQPAEYQGITVILGIVFFAFQIYCDFSGYSDIALGAAQVMGFELMENFRLPYFSASISEFWRRWHISLSTWFRDYLYIPLGGNKVGKRRWYFNLALVFVVSGLWHGANYTYIAWGGLHGFYLIFALIFLKNKSSIKILNNRYLHIAVTFVLVCVAWVFFRAKDMHTAWLVLQQAADLGHIATPPQAVVGVVQWQLCVVALALLLLFENIEPTQGNPLKLLQNKPALVRYASYCALMLGILFLGSFGLTEFIYFQF
jgi:D-alanyl-lipoteichoic acid acyltransferase DltB (MBOAT superfamily)